MSTFATWAVIIWAAPFVWFCILAAAAYVCEVCVNICDDISDWRYERRRKREADTQAADGAKE